MFCGAGPVGAVSIISAVCVPCVNKGVVTCAFAGASNFACSAHLELSLSFFSNDHGVHSVNKRTQRRGRERTEAETHESCGTHGHSLHQVTGRGKWGAREAVTMCGAQSLLQVRHRFLVGSWRPSVLMLVRSAAALATMRPVDAPSYKRPYSPSLGTLWPNPNRLSRLVPCGKGDLAFTVKPEFF